MLETRVWIVNVEDEKDAKRLFRDDCGYEVVSWQTDLNLLVNLSFFWNFPKAVLCRQLFHLLFLWFPSESKSKWQNFNKTNITSLGRFHFISIVNWPHLVTLKENLPPNYQKNILNIMKWMQLVWLRKDNGPTVIFSGCYLLVN